MRWTNSVGWDASSFTDGRGIYGIDVHIASWVILSTYRFMAIFPIYKPRKDVGIIMMAIEHTYLKTAATKKNYVQEEEKTFQLLF